MGSTRDWLSAREAVQQLDVKLSTLYSYVSRGLVHSAPSIAGRARMYAASDVERLRARHEARAGHSAVAASALRWGEPTLETRISDIRSDGPYYRGESVFSLLRRASSFECVAELLWTGVLPVGARCLSPPHAILSGVGVRADGLDIARLAVDVARLALLDRRRRGEQAADLKRARWLVGWLSSRALRRVDADTGVAARLLTSLGSRRDEHAEHLLDRALILCADHELNASTFAARVAASAGADLYACMACALHVLSGSLHGGASAKVEALLDETLRAKSAREVVRARLFGGEAVAGFGHRLYPQGDPRCTALFELALQAKKRSRRLDALWALRDAMSAAGQPAANLDAGLVALCCALGLPRGSASLVFAIGRSAGFIAHVFEQRSQHFLLRPRARYVGK